MGGFALRIVVKVGTSTLAQRRALNIRRTAALVPRAVRRQNAGHELVLVSSAPSAWAWASFICRAARRICPQSRRPPQWASAS